MDELLDALRPRRGSPRGRPRSLAGGMTRASVDASARSRGLRRARPRHRAAGHRHRVHGRGPLPLAALRRADRRRAADDGDVRVEVLDALDAVARPGAARRGARRPRRRDRPARRRARTSRCCAARGAPTVTNIFDTQVAAGLHRPRRADGLRAAAQRRRSACGCARARASRSWDQRPLTDEQLQYAREDVLHLLQLAARAAGRARRARPPASGRARSAALLESITDERDLDVVFARLPRVGGLDPSIRAVARELVEWREETARAQDKPVSSVLPDAPLVEIARRRPQDLDRLQQIRGLNEQTLRRRGRDILAAVERGREREPIPRDGDKPIAPRPARRPGDRAVARRSCARARSRPSWPTSSSPRAPTSSGSSSRCASARTSPTSARCRAGAASSSAPSCSSCSTGGARCDSATDRRLAVEPAE